MDNAERDLLARIDEKVRRLISDAESEKGTRARANSAVEAELRNLRERIDNKCIELTGEFTDLINQKTLAHSMQIQWLERIAWIAIGGIGFARWLFK